MIIEKVARETLTAVELDIGDELVFTLADGTRRSILLEKAWADVHETTLKQVGVAESGARTVCRMHCQLRIEGRTLQLVRWVGGWRVAPSSGAERSGAQLVGVLRPCRSATHNLRFAPVEGGTPHSCSDGIPAPDGNRGSLPIPPVATGG